MHVNESSALQLIKGTSNCLPKLHRYFNGTATFKFLTVLSAAASSIWFGLYLYDELPLVFSSTLLYFSSLLNYHKRPEVSA